jgi:hypothetical protein
MTGQEIRDLSYLKWRDPWAWMETMKGKEWDTLIKKEKSHFNKLANQPQIEKETRQMEKEILYAQQYSKLPPFKLNNGTIDITPIPNSRYMWKWSWQKKGKVAYDIDVKTNLVWYILPNEDEHYINTLVCEDSNNNRIWSKKSVSSQVAVIDDLCYYIKVFNYFKALEICVCDANTGKHEKILYKEPNENRDLYFIKGANKILYFKSEDQTNSRLYKIQGLKIVQIEKESMFQMPLGRSILNTNNDCILIRKSHYDNWEAKGKPITDWQLPKEEIEWINIDLGLVKTMHEGEQTIWHCIPHKSPQILYKVKVGFIEPNLWSRWEGSIIQSFTVKAPFETPYIINIINNKVYRDERKIQINCPLEFKDLDVYRFYATSKDGTRVPYIIIKEKNITPKAQLVYVYGAYGASTPIGWPYHNWYPLIKRKWAIVYALVRGGGDINAAWAEMARRNNRFRTIDDFEAVIRNSQNKLSLGPDKTVIYGRSAGGIPVGSIISRFPQGQLVRAAFTEVPYVDVLRTSSNPDLPLTTGEFNEFGNPLERIVDFKELLEISPVNTLPSYGAPGVFVISRVGLLDKQVFAYESFKWIQKLRGNASKEDMDINEPKGKYITYEKNEAHHYRPYRMPRFRAIDLAILNGWIDGKLKL